MSRAFNGGMIELSGESPPETKADVLNTLQQFIRRKFRNSEIANEIESRQDDRVLIFFADESQEESPVTIQPEKGELLAYGAFSYDAKEHPVQTIWENHFEIRDTGDGLYIRVSDWYGTTPDSWNKKISRRKLFI